MDKKMKGILGSILVIGITMTMIGASTVSWLSDEEKSVGNTLTAGTLDLKVDLVNSTHYRWNGTLMKYIKFDEKDLTEQDKLFDFSDVKPGDYGEFTLSLHLYDNPGNVTFIIDNIINDDGTQTEPELIVDTTPDGDLDDYIFFYGWVDQGEQGGWQGPDDPYEGDNIWQEDYEPIITYGHLSDISPNGETWDLSKLIGTMQPCVTYYIAIAWFIPGEDLYPGDTDPFGNIIPPEVGTIPGAGNIIQGDTWSADFTFSVEQIHG